MIAVKTDTINAGTDSLSSADYRDIYDELRQQHSLRAFVTLVTSGYSIAFWSKYERGEAELTRPACNELRRAVGLPSLVATVAESLSDVDADAEVISIGNGEMAHRVLKLKTRDTLTIYANGTVSAQYSRVTAVTRKRNKRLRREMTPAQATIWDVLTTAQRDALLGV